MSPDVLNILLGGGGLAFLLALGQAIRWMLDRAASREDRVEAQTKRWQRRMYNNLLYEGKMHDYYRRYASRCEEVIIRGLGETALPKKPPMPREPEDEDDDTETLKVIEK
jgi:hypothetical protein